MIIANAGPTLSMLRRKIGTRETVEFDSQNPVIMRVEALCAVGCYDLPIELPNRCVTDAASAWYIIGEEHEYNKQLDCYPAVIALATFNPSGRMTYAVLAIGGSEAESVKVNTSFMLHKTFVDLLVSSVRHRSTSL